MPKRQQLLRPERAMMLHFADGAALGCAFGLVLMQTDTAGLGTLLAGARPAWAAALFLGQGALIFGTVNTAAGVMILGADPDRGG